MILYFSGTGNSRYIAEVLAKETEEQLISLNQLLRQQKPVTLQSKKPWVIVCPTYAWRPPRVVMGLLETATFTGSSAVYFIMTCGENTLNAVHYVRQLLEKKEMTLSGFAEIKVPDNYIVLTKGAAPKKEIQQSIGEATERARKLSTFILAEQPFPAFTKAGGLTGKINSGPVNQFFYCHLIKGTGFYAEEHCIGCGKCAAACPLRNIELAGNRPTWGNNCTHCMACIGICPVKAVEYKQKTQGKERYYLKKRVK